MRLFLSISFYNIVDLLNTLTSCFTIEAFKIVIGMFRRRKHMILTESKIKITAIPQNYCVIAWKVYPGTVPGIPLNWLM